MGCPHHNITLCPLYHAMHHAGAPSCDDGRLDEGSCAVSRGKDYVGLVSKLRVSHPAVVAECEWKAEIAARSMQRLRNMQANGVH